MNPLFNHIPVPEHIPSAIMARIHPPPPAVSRMVWWGGLSSLLVVVGGSMVLLNPPSPRPLPTVTATIAGTTWWVTDPAHDLALLY